MHHLQNNYTLPICMVILIRDLHAIISRKAPHLA